LAEATRDGGRLKAERLAEALRESLDVARERARIWKGKRQAHLKPPPRGAVEKLGMVGCRRDDGVAREIVNLHEQRRDDSLDFAGLVNVAALLADRIELIEEQDAGRRPRVVEHAL